MGVVILQILQWILRIILFLLLLIVGLTAIILLVPIRYRAEGELLEKKTGIQGKITWFFYLIYMKFHYEEEFRIQVKVFGFKIYDSADGEKKLKKTKAKKKEIVENTVEETIADSEEAENIKAESKAVNKENENIILESKTVDKEKANAVVETNTKPEEVREKLLDAECSKKIDSENILELKNETERSQADFENTSDEKQKKSFSEKIDDIKVKIQNVIQKIKDIIAKIRDGKLKIEHYLELWNRDETQITFGRAKTKLGKMIKALLPRKWEVTGEVGFADPCTTGQLMGGLGAMYPILGNKVQIVPNFESEVMNFRGHLKGHIRLGNLLYQIVSLILNRHCFKFIKMIFDELGGLKKKQPKDNKE